jgi:hypothetical protein
MAYVIGKGFSNEQNTSTGNSQSPSGSYVIGQGFVGSTGTGSMPSSSSSQAPGAKEYWLKRIPQFIKAGLDEFAASTVQNPFFQGSAGGMDSAIKTLAYVKEFKAKNGREPTHEELLAWGKEAQPVKAKQKELRSKAKETKAVAGEGLSIPQMLGAGISEYLPSVLLTSGVGSLGGQLLGGGTKAKIAGLIGQEVLESQLVFNPEEYDKDNQLEGRMQAALIDLATVGVVKGTLRVFKKMAGAVGVTSDPVVQAATEPVLEKSSEVYQLSSKDFLDIIHGRKVMTDESRKFFSSPEWVSIARKYGARYDGYPDILTVRAPNAIENVVQAQGVMGLLEAPNKSLAGDIKQMVNEIASSAARGEMNVVEGKSKMLKVLFGALDESREYGLVVNKSKIGQVVSDLTRYMREVDDFNYQVAQKEIRNIAYNSMQEAGIYDAMLGMKRLANLSNNKADPDSLLQAYETWAIKNSQPTSDELAQVLWQKGFTVTDGNELAELAKHLPTKADIAYKLEVPKPYDFNMAMDEAIKVKQFNIEAPTHISKTEISNVASKDGLIENLTKTEAKSVDAGEAIIDQYEITKEALDTPAFWDNLRNKSVRNFPYAFESSIVASYGKAGKRLVTSSRRAAYKSLIAKEEFMEFNRKVGVNLLTDEEWINVRRVMEGKEPPLNENTGAMVKELQVEFAKWADLTDIDKNKRIAAYFPRFLSDKGRKSLGQATSGSEIVKKIAQKEGISLQEAMGRLRKAIEKSKRKGSFEFPRILDDVPEEYRRNPLDELFAWQNDVSRRYGVIQELGKDLRHGLQLINDMALMGKTVDEQEHIGSLGKKYLDKVIGKSGNYTDIAPVYSYLKTTMVVGKLNPLTSVANEMQAFISAYLDDGIKGVADTNKAVDDKLIKSLGLDNIRGKIGDEFGAESFAAKWMKRIGMESSEIRGFKRSANSSYHVIHRAWDALKKNPGDVKAAKVLNKYGLFPEDDGLARALKSGVLPDDELKMGILEGVRRKMFFQIAGERPGWATTPHGSVAYIFHNYLLSQLRLLKDSPLGRQIVYLGLIAPLTGLPIMTLRRVITGREMPQSPIEWYVGSSTAGSATPLDIVESAKTPQRFISLAFGGYSPLLNLLFSKNVPSAVRAGLDATPFPTILSQSLFNRARQSGKGIY